MTVQPENKPGRFLADHSNKEKNAVWNAAIIAVFCFIYGIYGLLIPQNPNFNYGWVTIIAGVASLAALYFALRKKKTLAITILLFTVFVLSMVFVMTTEGLAPNLGLAFVLIGTGISLFTLETSQYRNAIFLVLLGATVMMVVGFIWPNERFVPGPLLANMINVFSVFLIIIYAILAITQFPSFSLSTKIIVSMVAVILVGMMTISVVFTFLIGQALTDQVGGNLQTLAQNSALSVGELLASDVDTLETVATNGLLIAETQFQSSAYNDLNEDVIQERIAEYDLIWARSDDSAPVVDGVIDSRLVDELRRIKILFPDLVDLFVSDKYGALVAATSRPFDYYQGDEVWWQNAYLNGFGAAAIGIPYFDAEKESWLVEISVPIRGEDGQGLPEVVGVLQSVVRMDAFGNLLQAARFGETGEVEILMPDGRIMHVDEDGTLQIDLADVNEENIVIDLDSAYTRTNIHEVESLLSSSVINTLAATPVVDQLNWTVIVHQAQADGLRIVTNMQAAAGILIVLMVFVTGGLASFIGGRLSQPILELTAVAQQVSDGDLTAHAEVSSINEQDEIGTLATVFNEMTDRLQDAIGNLEFRVAERTRAIATSSDVGRRLSTILDREQLVDEVVTQVRDAFDYYHVHIYLMDMKQENLVMAGGTGNAGKQMLASNHQIAVGQGLVGRAALSNTPILVSDVAQEEGWLPNPLLPDTKAETAVPISVGERVLGVLDVQENKVDGLTQDDVELLVSITNQIAIAMQNAEYLESTQEQANQEALSNEINLKIQNANSVEQAMQIAVRELGRALDAPKTRIKLKNGSSDITHSENGNSEQ